METVTHNGVVQEQSKVPGSLFLSPLGLFPHLQHLIPEVNDVREEKQAPAKHQCDCAH